MQNLFQPEAAAEVISRIDKLQPTTQHQWGKMEVALMMAHCSATLDMASGRSVLPRLFIGRILGPFVRHVFTDDKPFSRNGPTHKALVMADKKERCLVGISLILLCRAWSKLDVQVVVRNWVCDPFKAWVAGSNPAALTT
jgi:hypothetical protein